MASITTRSTRELIEITDIVALWRALGGDKLKNGRGHAFWRGGDGYNVQLYEKSNTWRDHARGEGGGILALIEKSHGCTRHRGFDRYQTHRGAAARGQATLEPMPDFDWSAVRKLFPVLREWTYLNTATFGPLPTTAVEAMTNHFNERNESASTGFLGWFDHLDLVRAKIGRLIGADADDIAFCPNAGTGLSWLLQQIHWQSGDQVVVLENEFPNNLYSPAELRTQGVELITVPVGAADFDLQSIVDAVTERTRLAILSSVNYSTGLRLPLDLIAPELKRRGVIVCVDGTQSVGALHHDLSKTSIDYMTVHGYKWLCSPTGTGFVYVSAETREWLQPSVVSWRSHRDWRNVDQLHHGPPDLPSEAMRYEGGIQNFSGIFAMEAMLDLLIEAKPAAVEARVLALAENCRRVLLQHGGVHDDEQADFPSQIVTASFPGRDVSELSLKLKEKRVVLAARKGRLRVSPHFFNSAADIEALDEALSS